MKTSFILAAALSLCLPLHAKILRSAGLYYTPDHQIEANTLVSYVTTERSNGLYQTKTSFGTIGARFEHGMNEYFSWGSTFNYGMGNNEIKTSATMNKSDYEGLLDPEVFLKSHYDTENLRFHANGIFAFKSDAMIQSYDHSPLNFSSGGSSLALVVGMEGALGPTIVGTDLRGDLWKDSQELVERSSANVDSLYFREGGKVLSLSVFGELNNLKSFKPGLKLRGSQVDESKSELQDNQRRSTTTVPYYKLPKENQLSASLYGRIRLPAHFVLNFELYGMDSYYDSSSNNNHNSTYGISSNVGFKF